MDVVVPGRELVDDVLWGCHKCCLSRCIHVVLPGLVMTGDGQSEDADN